MLHKRIGLAEFFQEKYPLGLVSHGATMSILLYKTRMQACYDDNLLLNLLVPSKLIHIWRHYGDNFSN